MYTFTKSQDKTNPYDITQISMSVDAEVVTDIIEEFKYFLLGCGFAHSSIADGLKSVGYDMQPEESDEEE